MIAKSKITIFIIFMLCIVFSGGSLLAFAQITPDEIITPMATQIVQMDLNDSNFEISDEQRKEIEDLLSSYFDIRYQELSISPPKDFSTSNFGYTVSTAEEANDFVTTELQKLAVEKKYYEMNKLRYAKYSYELNYTKMIVDDAKQIAEINLSEYFEIICERAIEFDSKNPRTCAVGEIPHTIIIQKENEQWKIISDLYWDTWWRQFRTPESLVDEIMSNISK